MVKYGQSRSSTNYNWMTLIYLDLKLQHSEGEREQERQGGREWKEKLSKNDAVISFFFSYWDYYFLLVFCFVVVMSCVHPRSVYAAHTLVSFYYSHQFIYLFFCYSIYRIICYSWFVYLNCENVCRWRDAVRELLLSTVDYRLTVVGFWATVLVGFPFRTDTNYEFCCKLLSTNWPPHLLYL